MKIVQSTLPEPGLSLPESGLSFPESGLSLPESGTWHISSSRSQVSFSGRASRFAPTVRAAFSGVRGEFVVDPDPARTRVTVEIDLATLSTGTALYDDMLTAADPFRISEFPIARFRSTEVRCDGSGTYVRGILELAGTTSVLQLHGAYSTGDDSTGGERDVAVLTATGTIATSVLGRFSLPGASLLVPKTMTLAIDVAAHRAPVPLAA